MAIKNLMIVAAALAVGSVALRAQTIPEAVRQHGRVEHEIIYEYPPAEVKDIAAKSEVIARVLILKHASRLTPDQQSVDTDYTAQVLEIVHSRRRDIQEGMVIHVQKPGGEILIDGNPVRSQEADFPPLDADTEYVAFLRYSPTSKAYIFHFGAQGAFTVKDGNVSQVSTKFGKWNEKRGQVAVGAFIAEIAQDLAPGSRK